MIFEHAHFRKPSGSYFMIKTLHYFNLAALPNSTIPSLLAPYPYLGIDSNEYRPIYRPI